MTVQFTSKSLFFSLSFLLLGLMNSYAQVGIGTSAPQGALDVTSTTDGLLIPRIALAATNVATVATPTTSELVYNTFTSAVGPNQVTPGFYYWNGTAWIPVVTGANSDWTLTGNAGTVAGTNFVGTTDAVDYVTKTNNTEKTRVTSAGNFGIGTATPQGSLDVTSTTDGLLIPRIALAATNVATVATPTTSELVYNTFTSAVGPNQVTPGFYYWNGTTWIPVVTGANSDWTLTGNAGTVAGTNFVGTTDAVDYVTKTNNTEKTRVTSAGNFGIGTATPQGSLDVTSTTDGLLIPRIALAATNVATVATPTTSELVYNTFTSAVGPNQVTPGFYYWNGTAWIPVVTGANSDWKLTGNAGTVAGTNFVGTTDAVDYVTKTNNTEKTRVTSAGNFGIGTATPQGSLDVTSTTDGLLIPRIALAATNVATVATPTTSELVYNTFTSAVGPNQVTPGFYYWNGTAWIPVVTGANSDWKLTGNAGTVAGTNFVGTTDAVDYVTKTNNTEKTRVTSAGNFGIGTATPQGSLDVTSTTDGLLIPRIALAATNVATVATPTTSELVYNTFTSAVGPNQVTPGFYYWNGTAWVSVVTGANSDWTLTGNAGTVAGTNFVGTTDAVDYVTKTNNTEKTRVTSAGNFGIGTATPQGALDVTSTTDGLLIPRVALAATNVATVATPTASEMVYNTFTSAVGPNQVTPGFYYWNGTAWIAVATGANSDWKLTGNAGTVAGTNFVGTTDAVDYVTKTNNTEKTRVTSAGNFGIGTAAPAAKLDVAAGTTVVNSVVNATGSINDFLQFNIQNTSTGTQAQSGYAATADNGTATTNFAWMGINNSTFSFPATYNIGVANDVSVMGSGQDMYIANANNTKAIIFSTGRAATPFFNERMRILNNGSVGINTVAPGATDLFASTSSSTAAYAINGYSANNGSGVYGSISAGTTTLGAVQGEYFGTASSGTGIRGITFCATAGTTLSDANSAVNGQLGAANGNSVFSFGVKGQALNNAGNQVGGVIGTINSAGTYGMLGYRRSNGTLYAVLGNGAYQNNTSRSSQGTQESSEVGIGINGGFLGGHIKGTQYGLITKGDRFGSYTEGTAITNKAYAVVNESENGEKIATYASTSMTIDVTTKGMGELVNGTARIAFDKNFTGLASKGKPVIVTVSPMGETNGVYVASVSADGFTVKENKAGTSTVSFYWIAVGEKNNAALTEVPKEVLAKDFDKNLDSILTIDEDSKGTSKAMWWNGRTLEFGTSAPQSAQPRQAGALENAKPKG